MYTYIRFAAQQQYNNSINSFNELYWLHDRNSHKLLTT